MTIPTSDAFERLRTEMLAGFARIEARMDERFTELRAEMEQGFRQVGHAFGELEDGIETRFQGIDERLERIERAIKRITPNGKADQ